MRSRISLAVLVGLLGCGGGSGVDEGTAETGDEMGDGDGDSGDGDGDSGDGDPEDGDSGDGDGGDGDGDGGIWSPPPGTTWQWQLTGDIDTSIDVTMYDIDLFDAPDAIIDELHDDGRVVICYFSAGSHEDCLHARGNRPYSAYGLRAGSLRVPRADWRPDADDYPPEAIGDPLDDWPGERWVDIRHPGVRAVLEARLELAANRGCDGVEPDNVDGYSNDTGFALTAEDQLDFNQFLATAAHVRSLSVGLENDLEQIPELVDDFDWALDEECVDYDECELLSPFIESGKAVFHVEYVDDPADGPALADEVCPQTLPLEFSSLIKIWDLDAWRIACE